MTQNPSQSSLDKDPVFSALKQAVIDGGTNATLAKQFDTSESAVRRFRKRHSLNPDQLRSAYTNVEDDKAEALTPPSTDGLILDNPDQMLRERGLDPEHWTITHVSPNRYEGPAAAGTVDAQGNPISKVTYTQTKFTAQRRRPPELQIMAPRTDGWRAPMPAPRGRGRESTLYVVVGDQQAPFLDYGLHDLFCQWLMENTPDRGISLGDSVDFPDISRHQMDPQNTAIVNECLQTGYNFYREYIESSPDTYWQKLIGNHDERIRNLLLDKPKTAPLYGIKRPDTPESKGELLHELSHAMRLDELGIEVIDPHGKYDLAQINISNKLAVRHGWIARQGSGASALATLEHLGYSVMVGHTHRQSIVHSTKHEIDGTLSTITGVEIGCMCRVEQTIGSDGRIWPNYTVAPKWQQGFATVEVWPDGYFNIDTAKYVNGTLLWRDQRYKA